MNEATTLSWAEAAIVSVQHYLDQAEHLVGRAAEASEPERLLATRLAPEMFDTGAQLAIAIRFAGRSLLPPAGRAVPDAPAERSVQDLIHFAATIRFAISDLTPADLTQNVRHKAGFVELKQGPETYVLSYALPNMIFHLSMAYAAMRSFGLTLGKSDFDGMHRYPLGFRF